MALRQSRTSVDVDAVRVALSTVEDPEIHQPITELGMVSAVEVGRRGVVDIEISLTTASCPLKSTLRDTIVAAVRDVPGTKDVNVTFGVMGEQQRMELARKLNGGRAGHPFADPDSRVRIYAVASGKGGVGKSSVTANLAAALAQSGKTVGLLDADVWGYSVPQLFGVRRSPVAISGMMMPIEAHGVRLMSTGFLLEDETPVVWRGPMLHKALEQFLGDVHWGDLDVLLLDLPPGTGDVTLSLLELLPSIQLLVVTTPQTAAQTVATRVGRMARDMRVPIAGVIENMTELVCGTCGSRTAMFGSGGGSRLAEALDTELLGQVPLDLALREAGDAGVPAVVGEPQAPSAEELRRIAARLPVVRRSLVGLPLPLSVK
jgi:ATP-binding protein involved in chromosome partitioning